MMNKKDSRRTETMMETAERAPARSSRLSLSSTAQGFAMLALVMVQVILSTQIKKENVHLDVNVFINGETLTTTATINNVTTTLSQSVVSMKKPSQEPTAVICAVLKDEQRYVGEWVDYNLGVLQFDHIYIYDNSDTFNLKPWWEQYEQKERVTLVHYPGSAVQIPAYQQCGKTVKAHNRTWLWYGDGDEFLVLHKHPNIQEFATQYTKWGPVAVNWNVFGTSGQDKYQDLPVTYRFQCLMNQKYKKNKRFKSIIRVDMLDISRINSPHIMPTLNAQKLRDLSGRKVTSGMINNPKSVASIYHYYSKSKEEYVHKRSRGDVFFGSDSYARSLIKHALDGKDPFGQPLQPGTTWDNTAWRQLTERVPKYAKLYQDHAAQFRNITWSCHSGADAAQ